MTNSSILNSKTFRTSLIYAFFLLVGLFPKSTFAAETPEKFDPKTAILEHIGDSHSWPFALPFVKEKCLPLPIILYTDKGLEVFSSGHLMPEGTVYAGKYNYKLEGNKIVAVDAAGKVDEEASKKVWDISITRNVASMFMSIVILLIVFFKVTGSYHKRTGKAPKGL